MLGTICREELDTIYARKREPLAIVEIGCARDTVSLDTTEQRSTVVIAKWIEDSCIGCAFISIDMSAAHIQIARDAVAANVSGAAADEIQFMNCSGETGLALFDVDSIDVLLLDGDSDADTNYAEFLRALPLLHRPSVVIIDDCYGVSPRNGVNKGALIVPYATEQGWNVREAYNQAAVIEIS